MLEEIVNFISTSNLPAYWILAITFFITYIENIFPPSPSDAILLFLGAFVGLNRVGFPEMIIFSTLGSVLGFMTMFWLGNVFGHKIIESNKFKFINKDSLAKPTEWFNKYGYWVIVINRFLSGTRAVISFIAGISNLSIWRSAFYCAISALIWNIIILLLGREFGENWRAADKIMTTYGNVILFLAIAVALFFLIKFIIKKKNEKKSN